MFVTLLYINIYSQCTIIIPTMKCFPYYQLKASHCEPRAYMTQFCFTFTLDTTVLSVVYMYVSKRVNPKTLLTQELNAGCFGESPAFLLSSLGYRPHAGGDEIATSTSHCVVENCCQIDNNRPMPR